MPAKRKTRSTAAAGGATAKTEASGVADASTEDVAAADTSTSVVIDLEVAEPGEDQVQEHGANEEVSTEAEDKTAEKIDDKPAAAAAVGEEKEEAGKAAEKTGQTGDSTDASKEVQIKETVEKVEAEKTVEESVKSAKSEEPVKQKEELKTGEEKPAKQENDNKEAPAKVEEVEKLKEEEARVEKEVKQEETIVAESKEESGKEDQEADDDHEASKSDMGDETEEVITVESDTDEDRIPLPESFSKLRQLTVNIGPIKQRDLMSKELHSILNLTWNFEIKFEKKERLQDSGITKSERPGYVKIPFVVDRPLFLVTIAKKLGNLRIDGRDMSVKFPEVFNNAVKDCEEFLQKVKERKAELLKRQIILHNVPKKVEEDTIKAMFPEALKVTMNTVKGIDGTFNVRSVRLDFENEKAATDFLESNTDVQIGDRKVDLMKCSDHAKRKYVGGVRGKKPTLPWGSRGRGFGRAGFRGVVRGRGLAGSKPLRGASFNRGGATGRSRAMVSPRARVEERPGRSMQSPGPVYNRNRTSMSPQGRGSDNWGSRQQRQHYPDRTSPHRQASHRRQSGAGAEEDPREMMNYLKNTLARMEEKLQSGGGGGGGGGGADYGYDDDMERQRMRKRKAPREEQDYGAKRQYSRFSDRGGDDGAGKTCYKCGQPGHFARECPSPGSGDTFYDGGYDDLRPSGSRVYDDYQDRTPQRGAGDYTPNTSYSNTSYSHTSYDDRDDDYRGGQRNTPRNTPVQRGRGRGGQGGQRGLVAKRSPRGGSGGGGNVRGQGQRGRFAHSSPRGGQRNDGGGQGGYGGNRW